MTDGKTYWCSRCKKQHVILFQQAARYEPDPWWYTAGQVLLESVVLLILVFGIPFLIWLFWGAVQ